jgi:hypothetical protein
MDSIQRNALFTRIAVLLFGLVCYLFLMVAGLKRLRGESLPLPRSRQGPWTMGLMLVFGTVCVVVSLLPGSWVPRTPYQISKQAAAPFMLVIVALFFIFYVCWAALELARVVQSPRVGRGRHATSAHKARIRGSGARRVR